VYCVLGVGQGRMAAFLHLLGRWGGVVSAGAAVALVTCAASAAVVRGLASVA